jgi:integrase
VKGCRPLSDDKVGRIQKSSGGPTTKRDKALFLLGLNSRFRISGLSPPRVADMWQASLVVDQEGTIARRHMKKVEGRTVPLHPAAKAMLAEWLLELKDFQGLVEANYTLRSRKGTNRLMSRVQECHILAETDGTNGLTGRLGTHSLRKTFANKLSIALKGDFVKT